VRIIMIIISGGHVLEFDDVGDVKGSAIIVNVSCSEVGEGYCIGMGLGKGRKWLLGSAVLMVWC